MYVPVVLILLVIGGLLAGCIPGFPQPEVNVGNTAVEEPPTARGTTTAGTTAPTVTFAVSPTIIINGTGEATLTEAEDPKGGEITPASGSPSPVAISSSSTPSVIPLPDDYPRTKGNEPMLLGTTWGGASIHDFNRAECRKTPTYPGCGAYLEPQPLD